MKIILKKIFLFNLRLRGYKFKNKQIASNVWIKYYWDNNQCRYCKESIDKIEDAVITSSYWTNANTKFICHKDCKKQGEAKQVYECQKIDADCNDCFYFNRPKSWCKKFDKLTKAYTQFCSGYECFVDRKDGKKE